MAFQQRLLIQSLISHARHQKRVFRFQNKWDAFILGEPFRKWAPCSSLHPGFISIGLVEEICKSSRVGSRSLKFNRFSGFWREFPRFGGAKNTEPTFEVAKSFY